MRIQLLPVRLTRSTLLLIVCLLSCAAKGCTLFSDPICDAEQSVVDPRLLGRWEIPVTDSDEQGTTEMMATFSAENGSLTIATSDLVKGKRVDGTVHARVALIGDRGYISLQDANPTAKNHEWFLHKYRVVSKDEIHLYSMDDDSLAPAVRSGELPGRFATVHPSRLESLFGAKTREELVEMTGTPQQMRDYLKKHPDECFDLREPIFVLTRAVDRPAESGETGKSPATQTVRP